MQSEDLINQVLEEIDSFNIDDIPLKMTNNHANIIPFLLSLSSEILSSLTIKIVKQTSINDIINFKIGIDSFKIIIPKIKVTIVLHFLIGITVETLAYFTDNIPHI